MKKGLNKPDQDIKTRSRNALFAAELCNKKPVSARWLLDNPDSVGYIFSHINDDLGIDPWILIVGTDDVLKKNKVILLHGVVEETIVDPEFIIFI